MRKQGPEREATHWRWGKSEIRDGIYNPTYGMRRGPQNVALSSDVMTYPRCGPAGRRCDPAHGRVRVVHHSTATDNIFFYPSLLFERERIEGMGKSRRAALLTICFLAALMQGWVILTFHAVGAWLLYFGIAGAIPFPLLNGVHGDAEGVAGVVGGILDVLTLSEKQPIPEIEIEEARVRVIEQLKGARLGIPERRSMPAHF